MLKVVVVSAGAAAFLLMSQPALASQAAPCLPEAEFDAAFSDQVESGQQAIVTSRFQGRQLCSGKSFAVRLQELRQQFFPWEVAERERAQALRAAKDRAEREAFEAREARLAEAEYEADLAEAEWRTAMARAKEAEARLSRAEAERKLSALPPGRLRQSLFLADAQPADQAALERAVDQVIRADARSWNWNSYKPGSLFNTQLRAYDGSTENYLIFSRFRYSDNSVGWVEVEYVGRRFKCLTFHNDDRTCRQIGDSLSRRNAWNGFEAVLLSVVGSRLAR
ncbi:MAG: hypothetical protein AAF494_01890 [Pseudomonadota bacterium]